MSGPFVGLADGLGVHAQQLRRTDRLGNEDLPGPLFNLISQRRLVRTAVHGHAEFLVNLLAAYDRRNPSSLAVLGRVARIYDVSAVVHDSTSYQLRLDNTSGSVPVDRVRLPRPIVDAEVAGQTRSLDFLIGPSDGARAYQTRRVHLDERDITSRFSECDERRRRPAHEEHPFDRHVDTETVQCITNLLLGIVREDRRPAGAAEGDLDLAF
mmetsp:Transcript_25349/g.65886  ORF Transcript_25349/g.65886 Transcript_25349/m.65886 type:complete len:211 (-) Transcript_25349:2845-3477(-)